MHQAMMDLALEEARLALAEGEVPVGAVLVDEKGRILGQAHNKKEADHDISAHAEILCLRQAGQKRADWRMEGTSLYVTLEPCAMCLSAVLQARVKRLIYALVDPEKGAVESQDRLIKDSPYHHQLEVYVGYGEDESKTLLTQFFQQLRSVEKEK